MMGRVVVLGASLIDMNLRLDQLPTPGETRLGSSFFTSTGGKGANQAVAARRAGADVVFLSAFGDDDFGRQMRDRYFAEAIDIRHVKYVEGEPSGVALILVGDGGENLIGVSMGANVRLTPHYINELPAEVFDPSGIFLVSLEVPIDTVIRAVHRAKAAGMKVVLNPAPASLLLGAKALLAKVDVLTPNLSEGEALVELASQKTENAAFEDALRKLGSGSVVETVGASGCVVIEKASRQFIPAYKVEAVDTVGAGDAFNGALAAALSEGLSLVEAATRANAAGAIAVTRPGAQGALPSRLEIDRMVASHNEP
jgi:ribokinase